MYKVLLSSKAKKDLKKIKMPFAREKITRSLVQIGEDPFVGKKLAGRLSGYNSVRIWPIRIVYRIYRSEKTVFVIRIGHRQGVYKR